MIPTPKQLRCKMAYQTNKAPSLFRMRNQTLAFTPKCSVPCMVDMFPTKKKLSKLPNTSPCSYTVKIIIIFVVYILDVALVEVLTKSCLQLFLRRPKQKTRLLGYKTKRFWRYSFFWHDKHRRRKRGEVVGQFALKIRAIWRWIRAKKIRFLHEFKVKTARIC